MVHLEFGQDLLAQPHPLQAFELAFRPIDVAQMVRFIAEQTIWLR
jgi:hypothetical protein